LGVVPDPATVRHALDRVRIVAILDALLLVPLVIAAVSDADGVVSVLGPIHGVGFLILVYLTVVGSGRGLWGWWFPAIVVVTAGPPGSLIGDLRIRRQLQR
jgi:ABC-type Fe3+ transport system permease subunit